MPDPINPVLYIHIFLHTPLQVKVIRSAFYLTRVKLLKNKIHKIFHEMEKILPHLGKKCSMLKNVITDTENIVYTITLNTVFHDK